MICCEHCGNLDVWTEREVRDIASSGQVCACKSLRCSKCGLLTWMARDEYEARLRGEVTS